MPAIDVNDWQQHTQYSGLLSPQSVVRTRRAQRTSVRACADAGAHQLTQWFWEAVRALSEAERARLLQFVTGTSRVPVQGFKVSEERVAVCAHLPSPLSPRRERRR